MAIDVSKSFEVDENGLSLTDANGNVIFYIASGTGVPTGTPAPINTWYFDKQTQRLYNKHGSLNSDWSEFMAYTVDSIQVESFDSTAITSTTADGWIDKLVGSTTTKSAGKYLLLNSSQITNSNNNKQVGYRFEAKQGGEVNYTTLVSMTYSPNVGGEYLPITAVSVFNITSPATIDFRFQFGQTTGGGTGSIKETTLTLFKVVSI